MSEHQSIIPLVDVKAMDKPTLRKALAELQSDMLSVPKEFHVEPEVMHHFTDNVYVRTCLMKKGELVVGKIHRKEHIVIVSSGRANVISEEFGTVEITAPAVFVSPAGSKRALLILEDMVWTTVHTNSTNTRDLGTLEKELIAEDYSGLGE